LRIWSPNSCTRVHLNYFASLRVMRSCNTLRADIPLADFKAISIKAAIGCIPTLKRVVLVTVANVHGSPVSLKTHVRSIGKLNENIPARQSHKAEPLPAVVSTFGNEDVIRVAAHCVFSIPTLPCSGVSIIIEGCTPLSCEDTRSNQQRTNGTS
jgi:hypothetical protein